jgi:hypothetical protein
LLDFEDRFEIKNTSSCNFTHRRFSPIRDATMRTSTARKNPIFALILLTAGAVLIGMTLPAGTVAAWEAVTLNVSSVPLSAALNEISTRTGYRILVDRQWADTPVSAAFYNLSLEKGLKRLLKDFDHAIVFESDRTIRIIIYGQTGSSAGSFAGTPFIAAPHEQIEPEPEFEPSPSVKPPVQRKKPPPPDADDPSTPATSDTDAEQAAPDDDAETADENKPDNQPGPAE